MVNRVRRTNFVPQGTGETSGLAVFDRNKVAVVDYGVADQQVFSVEDAQTVISVRQRFTAAQIDAGAAFTALTAKRNFKYRLIDAFAIAVGGAVGTVTTIDILATAAASSRKLVAFGQAALTQSALVRAGSAGGVILADGASFTANDANTAVTVFNTGADMTGATHVDFVVLVALDRA